MRLSRTSGTRLGSALAASAVGALLVAAPAAGAVDGPGGGAPPTVDVGKLLNSVDGGTDAGGAAPPPTVDVGKLLNSVDTPPAPAEQPATGIRTVYIDDGLEAVQIALGVIAGAAFTAAGVAAVSMRRHRGDLAHPA